MTDTQFYIFLSLAIVVVVAVVIIIVFQVNTSKYIVGKKFKLKNYYEHQASTNIETVKLSIHNPNFIDSRVLGFGYQFESRSIDYMSVYLSQQETTHLDMKVIIPSRDFIYTIIDEKSLIETIKYYNQGVKKVHKLYLYVIDHQGETTKINAKLMKKLVNQAFKAERDALAQKEHALLLEEKTEKKNLKKQNSLIKKEKKTEKHEEFKHNLKMRFAKKEKTNKPEKVNKKEEKDTSNKE